MTIDKKSSIVNQMWISGSNTKYLVNFDKKVPDKNLSGGGSSGRGSVFDFRLTTKQCGS